MFLSGIFPETGGGRSPLHASGCGRHSIPGVGGQSVSSDAGNVVSVSLDGIPEQHRDEFVRDFLGRIQARLQITPQSDHVLRFDAATLILPDMFITRCAVSPMIWERTAELQSDGNDDILLSWNRGGYRCALHGRDEIETRPGAAAVFPLSRKFLIMSTDLRWNMAIQFKRSLLTPFVRNLDDIRPDAVDGRNPAHGLLFSYLSSLTPEAVSSPLAPLIARHVADLLAASLGGGAETAQTGIRAARLAAIKQHIDRSLHEPGLSVEQVSRRFGISSRYVRQLFAEDHTSFSDYLTERRLSHVHGCLTDRRQVLRRIADIAFEAGFVEPSTFYRQFRLRYGVTPGDVRAMAMNAGLADDRP